MDMLFDNDQVQCTIRQTTIEKLAGRVRRLAIATTDKCEARCAHCLMKSGPQRKERLSLDEIKYCIDYFHENSQTEIVVFTGGESTLLANDLFEAISYCAERGLATRLVTNAIWATNECATEQMIEELVDAGLTEINYSTDDFHCVWIPIDNIKRAWMASKGKGFETVLIANCSGPHSTVTPEYLQDFLNEEITIITNEDAIKTLPPPAPDGTRYLISRSAISKIGNGARLRDRYFMPYKDLDHKQLYGGCPGLMDPPTLNADGTLGVCCGINTEYNRILTFGKFEDVVSNNFKTSEFNTLLLEAIRILGPSYLFHLASESATAITDIEARTACEVCERLTGSEKLLTSLANKQEVIKTQISRICCF
jgi:hypothetical protein